MNVLQTMIAFVVALGVLIIFHEFGHYWAARRCGVKVLRFSIGFGTPLWSRRVGADRTEWVIAALPFGGYVKMLDEREAPVEPEEAHRAFNRQSVWKRSAIVAAGPIANFVLAVLVYWALHIGGVQEPRAILAAPEPGTIAARAGVVRGDVVRSVNDSKVRTWQDLRLRVLDGMLAGGPIRLEIEDTQGNIATRALDLGERPMGVIEGNLLKPLGLSLDYPDIPPIVDAVLPDSVAERAGLRGGDAITAVNDKPVTNWDQFVAIVRASPGTQLRVSVMRAGAEREIALVPEASPGDSTKAGRIGASVFIDPALLSNYVVKVRYGPIDALGAGVAKTWNMAVLSLRMLWRMIVGEISWRNLSGPVTIAEYAGQSAQHGIVSYLGFIAFISISLGVLNLLPIPVLDGGHLMYYSVEIVRGRPVSDRAIEVGQRLGVALLVALMVFALYNDLHRLLSGG